MSAHTPGCWAIEPREVFGRGDRPGSAEVVVWDEDGEGYEIIVHDLSYDDPTSQANARLIAAAPELLVALEGLARLYESDEGCRQLPEYLAAIEAIARARGQS